MSPISAMLEADAALAQNGARSASKPRSGTDRTREDFAACARLPVRDVVWFADQGVSAHKLLGYRVDPCEMDDPAHLLAIPGRPPIDFDFEVRRTRAQFLRGGRVVFDGDKRADPEALVAAFAMPAVDSDGVMIDLVVWHPRSGRIGSAERAAGWLAGGYLAEDEPLVVHRDPLSWLRANREGVVVVHEDLARPALLARHALQAADVAHGEALQAMLTKIRLPRIVVPAPADERIAA